MAASDTVPVDWALAGRTDPSIQQMLNAGVPMTRANYLDAYFDGNAPQEGNEELEMSVPQQLETAGGDFSGVGASELPQGPLPIPEGRMGISPAELAQAPQVKLGKAQQPPQLGQPPRGAQSPLSQTGPSGASRQMGGQFKQSVGFKPTGGQGGQGG